MNTFEKSGASSRGKRAFLGLLIAGSVELILGGCSTLDDREKVSHSGESFGEIRESLLHKIREMRLDFNGQNRNTPRDIEMSGPDEYDEYTLHSKSLGRATLTPIKFTKGGTLVTKEIIITPQNEFIALMLSGMDLFPEDICLLSEDSTTIFIKKK